jgi:hypothetical protein
MSQAAPTAETPLERQIVQLARALAAKVEARARQAPRGCVLAECEALLLEDGRQFLRDALAATLQQQADDADKKGAPRGRVPADTPAATRGPRRAGC